MVVDDTRLQKSKPCIIPCPFCAGSGEFDGNDQARHVICIDCGAEGPSPYSGLESDAIEGWNKRYGMFAQLARLFDVSLDLNNPEWATVDDETRRRLIRDIVAAAA